MFKVINLKLCFEIAKKEKAKYIGLVIDKNGEEEVIIVPDYTFDSKLNYILEKYDNKLHLATNSSDIIKITAFTYGNSFKEIEDDLMYEMPSIEKNVKIKVTPNRDFDMNQANQVMNFIIEDIHGVRNLLPAWEECIEIEVTDNE